MQDKKRFGEYIAEKRKKMNLTQEELAHKLYVIPTTISKWERGITYPDISMITCLCKELNISEHEFFTACDDETLNKEKREIKKYRTFKKWLFILLNLSYLIGIVVCFICNLVLEKELSWFFIVLIGIFGILCGVPMSKIEQTFSGNAFAKSNANMPPKERPHKLSFSF